MIAIYLRRNKRNGRHYVGQTVNPDVRLQGCWNQPPVLKSALSKYGLESFENIVLFWVETQDAANWWEKRLIQEYNTLAPYGYNISTGGHNGNPYAGKTENEANASYAKRSATMKEKWGDPCYRNTMLEAAERRWAQVVNRKKFQLSIDIGLFERIEKLRLKSRYTRSRIIEEILERGISQTEKELGSRRLGR